MISFDLDEKLKKILNYIGHLAPDARGLLKHPFLYLGILAVIVTGFVAILVDNETEESTQSNVFDESQYLFSDTGEAVPHIDLNIVSNSILAPIAPPFLVEGKVLASYGLEANKEITEYIAEQGDTLGSIAIKFDIS